MKGFLYLLVVVFLCQSLLCENVPDSEYKKPTGGVFIQGELPKHGISRDKVRTDTSSKVNITRVRIEEVSHKTTTKEAEPLAEAETEPQFEPQAESETEPQAEPETETEPQVEPETETEPQVEPETATEPQVELLAITDKTFLPCSSMPCPLRKEANTNPKFRPVTVRNSINSKPKDVERTDTYENYQLYLEFYHSLTYNLLLISLLCLTMILMSAIYVAVYVAKNGFGLKRFRKLENRDCGLSKYNF